MSMDRIAKIALRTAGLELDENLFLQRTARNAADFIERTLSKHTHGVYKNDDKKYSELQKAKDELFSMDMNLDSKEEKRKSSENGSWRDLYHFTFVNFEAKVFTICVEFSVMLAGTVDDNELSYDFTVQAWDENKNTQYDAPAIEGEIASMPRKKACNAIYTMVEKYTHGVYANPNHHFDELNKARSIVDGIGMESVDNDRRPFHNDKGEETGYTEVETPTLQSIAGGASARPFITHFNALNVDMYMRIATELYLKRLIVGGFEGVYEIGKNFRNEGMDRNHNPEFTCMELYVQYKDYNWMMCFTEQLLEKICVAVNGSTDVEIDGKTVSFKAPYRRLPILDAIKEKTGYDLNGMSEDEIREVCKKLEMEIDDTMGKGKLIDEIFGEFCEGTFIQPTFITDYPVEMSPLTKMHRSKPGLTERFELMVNGKELANAYSELNDPIDQEERFMEQMRLADKGDDEAMIIDQDFLRALQYGMPPTSGIGIGIDRLVMLMTAHSYIQDVLLFPQMRPEKVAKRDKEEAYVALGVPAEWVAPIQKAGFLTVEALGKLDRPGKLFQDLLDINKKYKLGLKVPVVDEVKAWVEAAAATLPAEPAEPAE